MEKTIVDHEVTSQKIGLLCAFILGMTVLIGSFVCILSGLSIVGLTGVLAAMVSLIGLFVFSNRENRNSPS